ncbi:NUDIX hydrolase [Candidatus Gracilibacteria bacterium]|nr:NUDIX hydrolase [Candidatus Gracilibacteria bacterium]
MKNSEVGISAQAIVIDERARLILEKNTKIGSYSFIGGAFNRDQDKHLIDTTIREVHEETGLIIDGSRFHNPEVQPITSFGTGDWKSTYFLLQVTNIEAEQILSKNNFIAFKNRPYTKLPIDKERFIYQVSRARKYFLNQIGY